MCVLRWDFGYCGPSALMGEILVPFGSNLTGRTPWLKLRLFGRETMRCALAVAA